MDSPPANTLGDQQDRQTATPSFLFAGLRQKYEAHKLLERNHGHLVHRIFPGPFAAYFHGDELGA